MMSLAGRDTSGLLKPSLVVPWRKKCHLSSSVSGVPVFIAGADGDDEGIVGRGSCDGIKIRLHAVAGRSDDDNAIEPQDFGGRIQRA